MHDLATLGLQIAGFAGLATVLGFLWKLIQAASKTQEVIKDLPPKVDSISHEVGEVKTTVDGLARDMTDVKAQVKELQSDHRATEANVAGVQRDVGWLIRMTRFGKGNGGRPGDEERG